jgi:serine/threonine-protein kinase
VKVADFGAVKDLRAQAAAGTAVAAPLTAVGRAIGTPYYMAPEQLRADDVDGRTDQFAWALCAFELLSGVHPYDAAQEKVKIQVVADGQFVPTSLVARVPELAPEIDHVLSRALAPERAQRFPDMAAAKDALVRARGARSSPVVVRVSAPPAAAQHQQQHVSAVAPTVPWRASDPPAMMRSGRRSSAPMSPPLPSDPTRTVEGTAIGCGAAVVVVVAILAISFAVLVVYKILDNASGSLDHGAPRVALAAVPFSPTRCRT